MNGKTRLIITRETLEGLLAAHVKATVNGFELATFTIHKNGSVELELLGAPAPSLPLDDQPNV